MVETPEAVHCGGRMDAVHTVVMVLRERVVRQLGGGQIEKQQRGNLH